jgi:alpha-glucosidase (family GH31 glycosyl hydrolase)
MNCFFIKKSYGIITREIILIAALAGILFVNVARAEIVSLPGDNMSVEVEADPFVLRIVDASGKALLETAGGVRFSRVSLQKTYRLILWWFWTRGIERPWIVADKVTAIREQGGRIEVDLGKKADGPALVRMRVRFIDGRTLRIETEVLGRPEINRMAMRFKKGPGDRYYGMGERFDSVEHSGKRLRNWAEEGGLGLFTLSRYIDAPFNPIPKGPDTTYYPVPFFMNPDKGYGLLLDDDHYSEFDFGKRRKNRLVIENRNRRLDLMIFYGPSPMEIIEAQTEYTGRIKVPPPWVFAPMAAVVAGEDRVLEVADLLRREHIPTSAVWSESWWWRVEWEVNRELYPNYEEMIAKLHQRGFRHLSYFQPYVTTETEAYNEGDLKGYFIKNKKGEAYDFLLGLWKKAQLDLTDPQARKWWTTSFFVKSEDMGVDGWMHDFGEHVPPDARAHDGRDGWELHNDYSLQWAKMGSEFWEEARPDNDYCFYIRGGYTGSQKYASVMWTGDQNANFDPVDGLPSNLPAITSVGISGHPVGTTDIAGYNCFVNRDADRELFMRWAELGALLPVMRNHRGQDEICDHWEFDSDQETLDHYKKYAVLHTALFPYIYTLVHEAAERGHPVVRHMTLEFPDDPETWDMDYQYLLGDRLLVAPVLERGAREWEVYFPEGEWTHWWSGKVYEGPGYHTVPAPLGEIPLFQKGGTVLPLFDSRIDTLVKEDREDLNGWDDANKSIKFVFAGAGRDNFELWDGSQGGCSGDGKGEGICSAVGFPRGRENTFEYR